jgi:hypothetical protein
MANKYNRSYHVNFSPGATSDDKIADDITYLIGREIVITEKLDGSNSGITKPGAYGRSHGEFTTNPWDVELRRLHSLIQNDIEDDVYIFGESMYAIHSIEYTDLESYFYMFGVRDNGHWLSWDEVEEYSYLLDIPTVPVLFRGVVNNEKELRSLVEDLVKYQSKLGGDIEGVVIRIADGFNDYEFKNSLQKWVRKNHVTTDEHWTRNWKRAKLKNGY